MKADEVYAVLNSRIKRDCQPPGDYATKDEVDLKADKVITDEDTGERYTMTIKNGLLKFEEVE